MIGHFGFSYIGVAYLLMLVVPNLIWTKRQPQDYKEMQVSDDKVLLVFERVGQVSIVITASIFSDYNPSEFSAWTAWLIISALFMVLYEAAWLRYFIKPTQNNLYSSFLFIPIPLAVLPAFAFLLLGIYGKVIWLIIAAVVFGIGHIAIHSKCLMKIKTNK